MEGTTWGNYTIVLDKWRSREPRNSATRLPAARRASAKTWGFSWAGGRVRFGECTGQRRLDQNRCRLAIDRRRREVRGDRRTFEREQVAYL